MSTLHPWQVTATRLVRRQGRRRFLRCLLWPPEAYAGRVRLGVICGRRRDEVLGTWEEGEHHPLVFSLCLSDEDAPHPLRADLLLETIASPGGRSSPRTATLEVRPPPTPERLYLLILLDPRALTGASAREAERLMRAALGALERDRHLRLALPPGWREAAGADGVRAAARLAGFGRLEALAALEALAGQERPAGDDTHPPLPFPPRTALATRALQDGAGTPPLPAEGSVRFLLLLEEAAAGVVAEGPAGETGISARWIGPHGSFLVHAVRQPATLATIGDPLGARAALWADAAARRGAGLEIGPRGAEDRPVPGCALLRVASREEARRLRPFVRRWNRGHVSPQLLPATPADLFTLLDELEGRGRVRLPVFPQSGS